MPRLPTRLPTASAILAAACLGLGASQAMATTLTFDDLPAPGYLGVAVTNGYGGLMWNNFGYLNVVQEANGGAGLNGYNYGDVSSPDVAMNEGGARASFSSATPFEFNSGYFTAAWNNGLRITITGFLNGIQVDRATFTVSAHSPTLMTFDWGDVTSVSFSSSGGTNAGYRGFGEEFALDDLVITPTAGPSDPPGLSDAVSPSTPSDPLPPAANIVPEPAAWALMLVGVGLVGGVLRRRPVLA
jgi:hypothetical protein